MSEPERPLLADLREEIGSLGVDLTQMVTLRWELARLEMEAAVGQIKRISVALMIFGVMVLSSLPILAVAAAHRLGASETWGISVVGWLLIFGLGLLVGGAAGGYLFWWRFRRRFVGIEQTLEELREDGEWLRQWVDSGEDSQEESNGTPGRGRRTGNR